MPFLIPSDLPAPLVPLSWLLGRWEGEGVVDYPTLDKPQTFVQEVQFSHDGRDFLYYSSRAKLLGEDGSADTLFHSEMGFWRVLVAEDPFEDAKRAPGVDVEVTLAHPEGVVEIYTGRATGARVDLEAGPIGRGAGAVEYEAAKRMYGHVRGHLMWVVDLAAAGHPLASYASARLSKAGDFEGLDAFATLPQEQEEDAQKDDDGESRDA